jgi:HTH-type transcriptional regulator/antitoxin HigA
MMLSPSLEKTVQVWPQISEVLFALHTEAEYERAVSLLDELIDEVGEDENHPLASFARGVLTPSTFANSINRLQKNLVFRLHCPQIFA